MARACSAGKTGGPSRAGAICDLGGDSSKGVRNDVTDFLAGSTRPCRVRWDVAAFAARAHLYPAQFIAFNRSEALR